jgi:transcriptional regulator with PAS, ATPase and Fis domain
LIPPLRERKEDIPLLINHFLARFENMYDKTLKGLSDKAKSFVMKYDWPGNIRELENLLERATLLTDHQQEIKLDSLFPQHKDVESTSHSTHMNINIDELLTEHFPWNNLNKTLFALLWTKVAKMFQKRLEFWELVGRPYYRLKKIDLP